MMSAPASAWMSDLQDQLLDGRVVDDLVAGHEAVMAVAGVGVERDVGDDADLRHGRLDRAAGRADEVLRVERLRPGLVAARRVGVGEERDRRNAEVDGPLAPPRPPRSIDRRSTPGIDGDRLAHAVARRRGRSAR